jgi:hypothetical protein
LASPSNAALETSGAVVAPFRADVLTLFQQLLPATFFLAALAQANVRENNRVYNSAVVVWLMIFQRLHSQGTLDSAVLELLRGLPSSFWPQPCKRVAEAAEEGGGRFSQETGAFNKARHKLSRSVVQQCCDQAFQVLIQQADLAPDRRAAFFLDGTTALLAHSQNLVETYPPHENQHGASHWPTLRLLVAHDLYTGLAARSEWGPVNGDKEKRVSEQGLLDRMIGRLPSAALLVADCNFGVFSVAWAAAQYDHPVVLRLTTVRAMRLAGGRLQDGTDRLIQWKPTREDRRSHPDLPKDACLSGRLIVRQVQPSNGAEAFLLAAFTTLEDSAEQVVELYGKRWNIELDLRQLKGTLRMDQLTCTSEEMVAKEIDVAMLTYNLVRAVIYLTALKAGREPRAFSFTRVRNVLQAFLPRIEAAADERTRRKLYADMEYYLSRCTLPKRKRRSYARAVWPKPKTYPARHA